MHLFCEYQKERKGALTFYDDFGFISVIVFPDTVFIDEFFVLKDNRKGLGYRHYLKFAENIARKNNISNVSGRLWVNTLNFNHVLSSYLRAGVKVIEAHENFLVVRKEVI